ncbi:helix-turn-helix transcriptional regulator [Pseudalkalibacillus berkeleyi]|uniref:Helix-turn-helix transcriptional regulator n=1 Tax=Pseudalkalibacillus berkeleyi TaxID=1069813 RepID=A0ABS9H2S9_9BACL|nr:helix-turn-helix transcriptional regulator [Pseudalkalibacillus berkeleyi]MCF6139257.1 helix-turn-helix transcriptional regulator [Pseudalkalibacillus berkeleyi]
MKKKGSLENRLHVCRAERKLSQGDLAKKVGVSRQTISSLEANRYNPSLILAFELARVLDTDITELFTYYQDQEDGNP